MQIFFSKQGFVLVGKVRMITAILREYAAHHTSLRDFLRASLH
ncbi:hypothetical protein SAMN02745218_01876 [Desulfofundulus australicus DSM 11792]|uniref:Uncharacterized protein n=1 Tax=Desulfofundulus australicus DSM 11792 TaxID=1121425 RepID=A0A1M5AEP7_9FIRM|nr:hypothetical protein SAMN02745218_01876 [Desulfofundulus australicus DSM 11792]